MSRPLPFFAMIAIAIGAAATASAGPVSLSDAQRQKLIQLVKSDTEAGQQFAEIKREADAALKAEPNPIHHIRSEGKLSSDPERIQTQKSTPDLKKMYALGFAYAVTGDAAYPAKARSILKAWAKVNESRGDPIDDTGLEQAIVAYDLVRATCSTEEKRAIDEWLRKTADAEMATARKKSSTTRNNWHSHRLKIVGLVGLLLDDKKLTDWTVGAFKEQIDQNLYADGSSYDFHERDALHYHCYDLEPLLTLAIAAGQAHIDLYSHTSKEGASIAKSVRFVVQYCDGSKTHAEFVNSKVSFDKKRADSGDAHYKAGTLFEPKNGRHTLELAAYFDPSLMPLVCKLSGKAERFPTWQTVLNAVRRHP